MDRHLPRHPGRIAAIGVCALVASCATGTSSATPSPTAIPAATSFAGYADDLCSAWDSMFLAVGNPDTGTGSELSKALDTAVEARDGLAAERLAMEIVAELETGRRFAAAAGGWAPAGLVITQMDRVFVAFEAMTSAKAAVAADTPGAPDPQQALEGAGGVAAWTAMFDAARSMARPPDAPSKPCANVPITP